MTIDETTMWPRFRSCGVRIDAVPLDAAAQMIVDRDVTGAVHLCNAYTLSLASKNPALTQVLERGSLNLPDGMPLVWIAKRLGLAHMTQRVYGPDLMQLVLDRGQKAGLRHYLYGSTPHVLDALQRKINAQWPEAQIVGVESPPFSADAVVSDEAIEKIAASGAQVVWVGLGTPKQDLVMPRFAEHPDVTFVAVGAAFDFIAGTKKQAPWWVQKSGAEWAYRFAAEPRRLWKRYLIGNSRFVAANVRSRPAKVPTSSAW
jgi:N-acetylglucosaminyldiphosphoundecaprenol N-acetyl-beta-D-mannosaminyltransferase